MNEMLLKSMVFLVRPNYGLQEKEPHLTQPIDTIHTSFRHIVISAQSKHFSHHLTYARRRNLICRTIGKEFIISVFCFFASSHFARWGRNKCKKPNDKCCNEHRTCSAQNVWMQDTLRMERSARNAKTLNQFTFDKTLCSAVRHAHERAATKEEQN